MPELPEVQTVVSDLNKKIIGDTITDFWSDWPKTIKNMSVKNFAREIKGKEILKVRRIGKNIFIDLSGKKTIYIHLKMTGHLLIKSEIRNPKSETNSKSQISNLKSQNYFNERVNQYIHHVWKLKAKSHKLKAKEKTLEFSDLRKFGKIVLVNTDKLKKLKEIKKLGMDIMSKEFTFNKFNEILSGKFTSQRKIRDILMDQNLMAGIGNIYLSEILFDAGIMPTSFTWKLSFQVRKKLYDSMIRILKKAIKLRGTSDSDYRDTSGAPGKFQKILKVYRRENKKCLTSRRAGKKCGTIIKRIKMGQRSVFYCSNCQR